MYLYYKTMNNLLPPEEQEDLQGLKGRSDGPDGSLVRVWCDADGADWDVLVWQTSGQEALTNLRQLSYPGTEVLLLGFDMTKGVSLENVPSWLKEVSDCELNVGAIILVGTKPDFYGELKAGGKGSDGQPLKTMEEMYAMAVQIGANGFVCTSAKTQAGYGLLKEALEGPAAGADPDTMSGQGEQYLDAQILRCAKVVKAGGIIPVVRPRGAVVEKAKDEAKDEAEPTTAAAKEGMCREGCLLM